MNQAQTKLVDLTLLFTDVKFWQQFANLLCHLTLLVSHTTAHRCVRYKKVMLLAVDSISTNVISDQSYFGSRGLVDTLDTKTFISKTIMLLNEVFHSDVTGLSECHGRLVPCLASRRHVHTVELSVLQEVEVGLVHQSACLPLPGCRELPIMESFY